MKTAKLALLGLSLATASIAQAATPTTPAEAPEALQVSAIDHVGMNVPDIDSAVKLFTDLVGAKVISDIRPGAIPAEWKQQFRWNPSSKLERFVMLQLEGGAKVELFQYKGPKINHVQPHEDDIGATHFALRTQDMARSLAVIKARGLKVLNEPITNPDGVQWFYFLTPWGSQIELVSLAAQ
ncbi:VOC family protein [Pseudomonas vanderleydeniana]|uniref:VOC family protein n=1 Tax=Pseudomonas vanderleydeniana TaxID=2745495 RepID=A0A9E6TUU4_9PSED|nr:VOC family protein [Pseudomonas vanderleydeniana]QXI31227.1 VOC family protein [Pseudomonas vanderleydeniana]